MFRLVRTALALLMGLAVLLAGTAAPAQDKADPHAALIGKLAPDLKGDFALNGKPVALSDLKGKVVLLDFWAVWCPPCVATFPHLSEWRKEYHDKGLEVVGVTTYYKNFNYKSGDNLAKRMPKGKVLGKAQEQGMLKAFASHHKLKHRLMTLKNEDWKAASAAYSVKGIPTAVLIDREGKVRMVKVGSGKANAEALEKMIKELLNEKIS
jgi:thiol-disulfide isomerase/thioredoxin